MDYARLARDYDDVRGDDRIDRDFWLAGLLEAGRLERGMRILDLGAGTGRFTKLLAEFARPVALDISPEMLARARAKGGFPLVLADAHALPFRRDTFDAVLLVMVVHQFADLPQVLREICRVSPQAVVATTDMGTRSLGILEEAFPSLVGIDRARFPAIEALVAALNQAGFARVDTTSRPYRRVLTVGQELERVRKKYISTLDLLPRGEFERGLAFLERELPKRYGTTFATEASFTFVSASR